MVIDNSSAIGGGGCGIQLTSSNVCIIMQNHAYAISKDAAGICTDYSESPPSNRTVTPDQISALRVALAGTHESLEVYCTVEDDEEIRKAFNGAGWNAGESVVVFGPKSQSPKAVAIVTKMGTPSSAAIREAKAGLIAMHIWFLAAASDGLENGKVAVSVDGNLVPIATRPQ
jgi:hypothetical protein